MRVIYIVTCPHELGLESAVNLAQKARLLDGPCVSLLPAVGQRGEAACSVCRTALRFIHLHESAGCGPTEHQWLAKELAKLLHEACTRLLLSSSSAQEERVARAGSSDLCIPKGVSRDYLSQA